MKLATFTPSGTTRIGVVDGDQIATEAAGKDALRTSMTGYFESLPSARSEILSSGASGAFVTAHERAYWTADGQERSQVAVAVYEIRDGLVRRVWYFPAA